MNMHYRVIEGSSKRITKTDAAKGAYVPNTAQVDLLSDAGYHPKPSNTGHCIPITDLHTGDLRVLSCSYYAAQRNTKRKPEIRLGRELINRIVKENVGKELWLTRIGLGDRDIIGVSIDQPTSFNMSKLAHPIADIGFSPTTDESRLDEIAEKYDSSPGFDPSYIGQEGPPRKVQSTTTKFERCPRVVAILKRNAGGICELCEKAAPFKDKNGVPFLEVHHVVALNRGGLDTVANAVALCPNCHRKCHHHPNPEKLATDLYLKVSRLHR